MISKLVEPVGYKYLVIKGLIISGQELQFEYAPFLSWEDKWEEIVALMNLLK